MKIITSIITLCFILSIFTLNTAETKPQKLCPVMNAAINKDIYYEYENQRIYACCKGCINKIQKDPAKYIAILKEKGEEPEKIS